LPPAKGCSRKSQVLISQIGNITVSPDPVTVTDLASATGLPLGVVRVLLDDLAGENLVVVYTTAPRGRVTDRHLLRQVLDGLHAL